MMENSSGKLEIVYVSGHTVEKGQCGYTHVMEVVRRLRKRGFCVRLIAVNHHGKRPSIGRRLGAILVVQLRAAFWLSVAKVLRKSPVLYVRYHPLMPFPTIVARLLRAPSLLEVNGRPDDFTELWTPPKFVAELVLKTIAACLRAASSIIVVAEGLSEYLRHNFEIGRTPLHVVYNGVNTELFKPLDRRQSREKLRLAQGARIVTYVGALAVPRGLNTLLDACQSLVEAQRDDIQTLIVGGGVLRKEIERALSEEGLEKHAVLVGQVPMEEVPDYICAADVCVAPYAKCLSNASGQSPLKVYEYMACGRPVVVSDFPWISDIVREGHCGLSVEADNVAALRDAVVKLLDNPAEADEMGRRGRQLVEKRFTWDITTAKIAKIIAELRRQKKG